MSTPREVILNRVRKAVADGNRAGSAIPLPVRGDIGRQGAGTDPVTRFCDELTAAGGRAHLVPDADKAAARMLELVHAKAAARVLLGRGPVLDGLHLSQRLRANGIQVQEVDMLVAGTERDQFFQADLGISGVAYAVAETGTLVMASARSEPRSLSLLPPVHIAVVGQSQLLPDLFDFFAALETGKTQLPSCLSLITGPSKTGDIELKLVTGVHGPGELHVVFVTGC
jgi:L-lactate dehydrogenase complex protein LldG